MNTPAMKPNLMGRTNGHQVMTLAHGANVWEERGEYAGDKSWQSACASKETWERRGHSVRIYEIWMTGGKLVYETEGN